MVAGAVAVPARTAAETVVAGSVDCGAVSGASCTVGPTLTLRSTDLGGRMVTIDVSWLLNQLPKLKQDDWLILEVEILPDGRPSIKVTRLMTHFHSNETGLLIQQNPARPNFGRLTGISPGGVEALLPADVTFDQYLLLSLRGKLYINLEPLVMATKGITEFPPIGTTFLSQTATLFYDIDKLDGGITARDAGDVPASLALASQSVCGSHLTHYIDMPSDN